MKHRHKGAKETLNAFCLFLRFISKQTLKQNIVPDIGHTKFYFRLSIRFGRVTSIWTFVAGALNMSDVRRPMAGSHGLNNQHSRFWTTLFNLYNWLLAQQVSCIMFFDVAKADMTKPTLSHMSEETQRQFNRPVNERKDWFVSFAFPCICRAVANTVFIAYRLNFLRARGEKDEKKDKLCQKEIILNFTSVTKREAHWMETWGPVCETFTSRFSKQAVQQQGKILKFVNNLLLFFSWNNDTVSQMTTFAQNAFPPDTMFLSDCSCWSFLKRSPWICRGWIVTAVKTAFWCGSVTRNTAVSLAM